MIDLACPAKGDLSVTPFFNIIAYINRENINCSLRISDKENFKTVYFKNNMLFFAESTNREENFGNYLVHKKIITREQFKDASELMQKKGIRFGRSLVELNIFTYENLFNQVKEHLMWIAFSCFNIKKGAYSIDNLNINRDENIGIGIDINSFLISGFRDLESYSYFEKKLIGTEKLHITDRSIINSMQLKNYEFHVYDLVRRFESIEKILKQSELTRNDTLKILYLLIITGAVSDKESKNIEKNPDVNDNIVRSPRSFSSYLEALRYYNLKYEMIFKMLSKEIGPIAISILNSSIESIKENLPSYMKNATLDSSGKLYEDEILKKIWYNDFDENIPHFLKGLEEILFAEIFAVKKNLGDEYEKQIFKWINGIEERSI